MNEYQNYDGNNNPNNGFGYDQNNQNNQNYQNQNNQNYQNYQNYNDPYKQTGYNGFGTQELPGKGSAIGSMVCGILGIVMSFCYGIPGLILSIIALVLYSRSKTMNNGFVDGFGKAGLVCGIIGLVFSLFWTVIYIFVIGLASLGAFL